jgi:HD-GYP domain-containing protein (c-di-GMP phosphodiesterase class II)
MKAHLKRCSTTLCTGSISITLVYLLVAVVWIVVSDSLLLHLYPNMAAYSQFQTIRAIVYVLTSALILYWVMERKNQLLRQESKQKVALVRAQETNYLNTIDSLVDLVESRDAYTAGHSRRVAYYSGLIASAMKIPKSDIIRLERAAIIHDIGKIAIPDSILLKPYKLNPSEYELIKMHVNEGYRVLQHIPLYNDLAEIVRYHHERYDGSGYPHGIKEDQIPLLSHIMAVADSFDAMTTSRIYKMSIDLPDALEELKRLRGSAYHPEVVDAALAALSNETIDTDVTQSPVSAIEEERMSYYFKDPLTGFYTAAYLQYLVNQHHFLKIADNLRTSAHATIIRFHGDSFLILCNKDTNVYKMIDSINQEIADTGVWISIHRVNVNDALKADKEIHHWLSDMIRASV